MGDQEGDRGGGGGTQRDPGVGQHEERSGEGGGGKHENKSGGGGGEHEDSWEGHEERSGGGGGDQVGETVFQIYSNSQQSRV